MFFNISEDNCNVTDITCKARTGFDDQQLMLVNSSCLRIEDSAATRGEYKYFFM